MSEYENMTVAELKELLKDAGLPVSGKKADLIARLEESDTHDDHVEDEVVDEDDDDFDNYDDKENDQFNSVLTIVEDKQKIEAQMDESYVDVEIYKNL